MNPDDETPYTQKEVDELVSKVPPPHVTQGLITAVKTDLGAGDPFRVKFLKWLSVTCFLIVVLIALWTLLDSRNAANDRADAASTRAECRAVVNGELDIAKAEGVEAGNTYNATLGEMLVLVVNRQTTDPRFTELSAELDIASQALRASGASIERAIERQNNILALCADGVP